MERSKAKELAVFVTEQLAELEDIRKIPMMGGYIFYYRERIFGGIYEPGFMVKKTEASRKYMPDSVACPPYDGAKEMLPVTIIDDRELLQKNGIGNVLRAARTEAESRKVRQKIKREATAITVPPA